MTKIELRLYIDPSQADLFINIKLPSGGFDRYTAVIDTGCRRVAISIFNRRGLPNKPSPLRKHLLP